MMVDRQLGDLSELALEIPFSSVGEVAVAFAALVPFVRVNWFVCAGCRIRRSARASVG